MTTAAMAVEAAETAAKVAAPVVTTGTLDYKKVALVAVGVTAVGVGTYFCIRGLKKRKANKIVIESAAEPVVDAKLNNDAPTAE